MSERPAWFVPCIVGAVFALIVMPATASTGFFTFVLNVAALACFVAPIVVHVREQRGQDSLAA